MIRYALICDRDHAFEGWFASSADYDDQAASNQVQCPWCASTAVKKQIMAPAVAGTKRSAPAPEATAQMQEMMMAAAAQVRAHVETNFDYVGDAFAREARAIHEGDSEARGIYGEVTAAEARALREDGVPCAPLPPALAPRAADKLN